MNKIVFIKTGKSILKLNTDEIIAIQGLGNYVQIHTSNNDKHIHYDSLEALLDKLPDEFMRIHNSYIINFIHIDKVENNHVFLSHLKIPVGPSRKECFNKKIDQYKL